MNTGMSGGFEFRVDWFSEHAPHWAAALGDRGFDKKRGARALFVGPHEGRSVVWALEHVFRGAEPEVVCVVDETRDDVPACVGFRGKAVAYGAAAHPLTPAGLLRRNLGELARRRPDVKVRLISGRRPHADALVQLRAGAFQDDSYDFVYIDAHSSKHALEAAALAFPLLRKGAGVMAITNYTHGRSHDAACPRRGIDGFLDAYVAELRVLRSAFHVLLERRAKPLRLPSEPCRAEVYDDDGTTEPVCDSKKATKTSGVIKRPLAPVRKKRLVVRR